MNIIKTETERDRANLLFQIVMGLAIIGINGALLAIISTTDIPQKNDAAFNIFLGNAMGWFGAIVAFGFPNNIGNAKKDDTINKLADKTPPVTVDPKDITPKELIDGSGNGTQGQDTAGGSTDSSDTGGVIDVIPARADDPDDFPAEPPSI